MSKPKPTKHSVIVFNQDNTVSIQPVLDANADCVETESNLFYLQDAKTYIDTVKGGCVYVFNADLPALVEAERLKGLRRSTALKRAFEFQNGDDKFDWFKLMPWIAIFLLVLFK